MMKWNRHEGSAKGWRFNPKVLRWACYVHSTLQTRGYVILSGLLKLPSLDHIRRLKAAAAPLHTGVQLENIRVSTPEVVPTFSAARN